MEKLLELLNQFEKERIEAVNAKWLPYNIKLSFRPYTEETLTNKAYKGCQLEICSKYYRFIKWLVQNDKINISMLWKKTDMWFGDKYTREESLLMVLSISNRPIKDLISYLK